MMLPGNKAFNTFRWSTIPQRQFIAIIIKIDKVQIRLLRTVYAIHQKLLVPYFGKVMENIPLLA